MKAASSVDGKVEPSVENLVAYSVELWVVLLAECWENTKVATLAEKSVEQKAVPLAIPAAEMWEKRLVAP